MAALANNPALVVIVGETAGGKSALAMDLSRRFDGEIICADSRTVYTGMDIGTAKPTPEDRAEVPHHLLDVVEPNETFTAADFKRLANEAIQDISSRGRLPIMVGGSGLYVDSVLYDFQFSEPGAERDEQNPRHLKRTSSVLHELRQNTLMIGITVEREMLKKRIYERVEHMVTSGFVEELQALSERYDTGTKAFSAPGYKAFMAYLGGELNLEQAKEQFVRSDLQLAKRQRTWFKRNKSIHWIQNPEAAKTLVQNFLPKVTSTS